MFTRNEEEKTTFYCRPNELCQIPVADIGTESKENQEAGYKKYSYSTESCNTSEHNMPSAKSTRSLQYMGTNNYLGHEFDKCKHDKENIFHTTKCLTKLKPNKSYSSIIPNLSYECKPKVQQEKTEHNEFSSFNKQVMGPNEKMEKKLQKLKSSYCISKLPSSIANFELPPKTTNQQCLWSEIYESMADVKKLDKLFTKIDHSEISMKETVSKSSLTLHNTDDASSIVSEDYHVTSSFNLNLVPTPQQAKICYNCLLLPNSDKTYNIIIDGCWDAFNYFCDQPGNTSYKSMILQNNETPAANKHYCQTETHSCSSSNAKHCFCKKLAHLQHPKSCSHPATYEALWSDTISSNNPLYLKESSHTSLNLTEQNNAESIPICYECLIGKTEDNKDAENLKVDNCWDALQFEENSNYQSSWLLKNWSTCCNWFKENLK